MYSELIAKTRTLVEALPYITKFHSQTIVIKYGGSLMLDDHLKELFATDIVLLKYVGMNPVIVHGGGKEISRWMKKVGKEAVFIDGLRFTDEETMEITEMVLSGKINSEIVSLINRGGGKAVGLSGKDADLFTARKIRSKDDRDLGLVGDIDATDVTLLRVLCERGYIPVISSVGNSREGESLNMNADHVAAGIATALGALKLIYLTDVTGVLVEDQLQANLSIEQAEGLLGQGHVNGGMLPKLECSINSVKNGVANVHIINGSIEHAVLLELFTHTGIGTMVTAA